MWEFRAQKNDRLDRLLREQNASVWMSRQAWEEAILSGRVRLSGRVTKKAGEQVSVGETVQVDLPPLGLTPSAEFLSPIWTHKNTLAVFNKPAGIATYPLYPWERGTLANHIARYVEDEKLMTAEEFSLLATPPILEGGLLQRLDRDTSGLVCVAFTADAKALYRKIFSGEVNKGYLAIVSGAAHGGKVYFPKSQSPKVPARLTSKEGDTAVELEVKVLSQTSTHSLAEIHTTHGLRHVVRAGMAALGFPLVGDTLYGGSGEAPFHQLHAGSLLIPGFSAISASVPQSFLDCAQILGLNYSG